MQYPRSPMLPTSAKDRPGNLLRLAAMALLLIAPSTTAQNLPPTSTICVVAESGLVLSETNADQPRPPASMVKMMLLFLAVEGLEAGTWQADTPIAVSKRAQHMGGTQVYLEAGETWPLRRLLTALAVASANDAAMAVAEGLWGSKEAYLKAANQRAAELGMKHTMFRSVHGLPPDPGEKFDQSTARDMATLACACVQRPQILAWTSQQEFLFRQGGTTYYNTNKLLWRMENCDGLKTGFIRAAGFCVTATAMREDIRLISVVMGHPTKYGRFNQAEELMDQAFPRLERVPVLAKGVAVGDPVPVTCGSLPSIRPVAAEALWAVAPRDAMDRVVLSVEAKDRLEPPLNAGSHVGRVVASLDGHPLARGMLVAPVSVVPVRWRLVVRDGVARWEEPTPTTETQ